MITTFEEIPWHLSKHATPFIEMFQKLLQSLAYTSIDSGCTWKNMHLRGFVRLFAALDREKLPIPYKIMFIIGRIFACIILIDSIKSYGGTMTIILIICFTQITYVLKTTYQYVIGTKVTLSICHIMLHAMTKGSGIANTKSPAFIHF